MTNLYYTPPTKKQFNELKEKAIEIWRGYDDTHGYASEKINKIKDLENVGDNFMFMVAMFDFPNQQKLAAKLSEGTKKAVAKRLKAGGWGSDFNPFLY
jgi:hypothetical protein